jgi:hypothetical protein
MNAVAPQHKKLNVKNCILALVKSVSTAAVNTHTLHISVANNTIVVFMVYCEGLPIPPLEGCLNISALR